MPPQINLHNRFNKSLSHFSWLCRALAFFSFYAVWVLGFRLLTLTFITYFTISPTAHFQDISDAFSSNEVSLMSLASVLFVSSLYWLNPISQRPFSELISRENIEKKFLPGFVKGAFLAGVLVFIFVLIGIYRYLGYFIQFEEAPLELANVVLRMCALGAFAYCEEYIFHYKIYNHLKGKLPDLSLALIIALLYSGIKILQFDLGLMQLVTLFLISLCLFFRSHPSPHIGPNLPPGDKSESSFARGAGLWAAALIIFQPVLSLPIFGNDFSGLLLLRYNSTIFEHHSKLVGLTQEQLLTWTRFLSGGAGGPLSSFTFQLVLIIDITRNIWIRKTKT